VTGNYKCCSATKENGSTVQLLSSHCWALCLVVFITTSLAAQNSPRETFESVFIGAYDADAWNGIVFDAKVAGQSLPFAIRIGSKSSGFLDGERVFNAVSLVGPHAPDSSYSLIGWRHYCLSGVVEN
jgi:hypothetical protein